jgi:LAO/AO transport system kinase
MGDGIQAAKAGILEIGDLFVVNKADRDGAAQTVRDLRHMLSLGREDGIPDASGSTGAWRPAVVKTVAARNDGIDRLVEELDRHREWIDAHGVRDRRRRDRAAAEIEAIAVERVRVRIGDLRALTGLAARVAAGALDPYAAADELERGAAWPSRSR